VHVAAGVVAQVQDQGVPLEGFRCHLDVELLQALAAHVLHVDVGDPAATLGVHLRLVGPDPLVVEPLAERAVPFRMHLHLDGGIAPAEGQRHLGAQRRTDEVRLAVDRRVHRNAVDGHQHVAGPDVLVLPVERRVVGHRLHPVRIVGIEDQAGGLRPRAVERLFLRSGGVESEMGGAEFAQQVVKQNAQVGARGQMGEERLVAALHRLPVGAVKRLVVEVLLQARPHLVEHLGKLVGEAPPESVVDLDFFHLVGVQLELVDVALDQEVLLAAGFGQRELFGGGAGDLFGLGGLEGLDHGLPEVVILPVMVG